MKMKEQFICVRHEKVKITKSVCNKEAEHDRKDHFAERDNVLQELTARNIRGQNFAPEKSIEDMFQERKRLYNENHKKKLRKDAVHCIDSVFIRSECSPEQAKIMLQSAIATMSRIAPGCPMRAWAHFDELGECHVHMMTVPINNSGECITDNIMRRESLQAAQDIFAEECNKRGLICKRGKSKEERLQEDTKKAFHQDNFAFLNSEEGRQWLENKDNEIAKRQRRIAELRAQEENFHSIYGKKDASLDEIINSGRY